MTTLLSDSDNSKQTSHLYYDAIIENTHSINEDEPYLRFNEKRKTALLKYPQNYKMSIVRFMCDTHTLPIMQPSIMTQEDQNKYFPNDINFDRTNYSITIEKNRNKIQQYIEFVPQDTTKMKPSNFNEDGSPYYLSGYYDIFSYEHFISMVNDTIKVFYHLLYLDIHFMKGCLHLFMMPQVKKYHFRLLHQFGRQTMEMIIKYI